MDDDLRPARVDLPDATPAGPPEPGAVAAEPPTGTAADPGPSHRRRGSHGSFLKELPVLVAIALGLALLIKAFLFQAFYIPSGSMEQTLQVGDRVLVNKVVYRFRDVHRGEIVVFNGQDSFTPEVRESRGGNPLQRGSRWVAETLGFSSRLGERDFIKRVIGVAGDTVQCCDERGRVTVNGAALNETYVHVDNHEQFGPVTVPKGRLWVMGDHRSASSDSRAHQGAPGGGTVSEEKVIGRAFVVVWPLGNAKGLGTPDTFEQPGIDASARLVPYGAVALLVLPLAAVRHRCRRRRGR